MVILPPFKNFSILSLLLVVWLQQTQEPIVSWEMISLAILNARQKKTSGFV